MRRSLVALLAIAAVCLAAPAAPAPPAMRPTLYTFYEGYAGHLGLTWQGIAVLNTATGVASKLCNLVIAEGTPNTFGPSVINPANSAFYSLYNDAGRSKVVKISLTPAVKCAVQEAFPLSSPALDYFAVDAVTSAIYAVSYFHNAIVVFQVDLASGATKEVATLGTDFAQIPYAMAVANGTLVAWYPHLSSGETFNSTTVLVANLATNKTVTAFVPPLNGVSLMSSAFTYYKGSWLGLSTYPIPFPGKGNSSSYLLEFDPIHLTLKQVNNDPIVKLNTDQYPQSLVNFGYPSVQQEANYLYFLQQPGGPLLIYDLANQVLVRKLAVPVLDADTTLTELYL